MWINGDHVLNLNTGSHIGQRSWVYLAKGLHEFRFEGYEEQNKFRFNFMYPTGERLEPLNAPASLREDKVWLCYRPLDSMIFHDPQAQVIVLHTSALADMHVRL